MDKKIKATKKMIEFRKAQGKKEKELSKKQTEFNQQSQPVLEALNTKLKRLNKDKDLAVEAAIGFGLAVKGIEEGIRRLEEEISKERASHNSQRPPYIGSYGDFKAEFGVNESEVDWSLVFKEEPETEDGVKEV